MYRRISLVFIFAFLCLSGASAQQPPAAAGDRNPFFIEWTTPFGVPPFDQIRPEHFIPAFTKAIDEQRSAVDRIANDPEAPSFANTIGAMDDTGPLMQKVGGVFNNLLSSETND